ncbi:KAR9-domain-containing protein, partial [Westerdykella ornata]
SPASPAPQLASISRAELASSTPPQQQQQSQTHPPPPQSTPSPSPATHHRSPLVEASRKLARNVSPGLLARMKFLNQTQDNTRVAAAQVGRISESTIRELDDFHKDRSIRVQRRGTAWSRSTAGSQAATPLIPQLTGESVPALAMDQSPLSGFESNRSSFVSTSDRVLPSDSEAGDAPTEDKQKYRLPDVHKAKSLASQPVTETNSSTDAEQTRAPTPPPKDVPPAHQAFVLNGNDDIDVAAYFHRRQFSRANSIYTLSRASFTNQLQQLTSITLPPAASLSSSISAIPTSTAAGRALHEAANQIKIWMAKATEVLNGLDAEDDVEWAAAAGREGLAEVDAAIGKFEGLVTVYITAIEDLQSRPDIAALPAKDLTTLVAQMEDVVTGWTKIKKTLKGIKAQVELAMEWEELWNSVLGEIGHEIENLSRLVFEMEERRHRAISDSVAESAEKFDIAELETIVEETPRQLSRVHSHRFSLPATAPVVSPISPIPQIEKENSRLLALFAKLQPLRASLDFLPMRLSSFHNRASKIFPSACDELMRRKEVLERQEKKLEADADALREELGEDKWVHSFRQAGSKAIAMYESMMKSIQRLRQAMEENDEEKLGSRISTYKDKREHYPPSMKRVLELIDIEMKNRSTVNGEILRIQQDVRQKVSDLEQETRDMDAILDEFTSSRKLRDSISTVFSARTEQSLTTSALETPNSSPASSVIMSRKSSDYGRTTPAGLKSRQPSVSSSKSSLPSSRRYSSLPATTLSPSISRKSLPPPRVEISPSRAKSSTPTSSLRSSTSTSTATRPRWNPSTNMRDTITLPRRPLASTLQSPSTPARGKSPALGTPGSSSRLSTDTPTPARQATLAEEGESPIAHHQIRSASAMASRRVSMLPTPKQRTVSGSSLAALTGTPVRSTSRLGSIDESNRSRTSMD